MVSERREQRGERWSKSPILSFGQCILNKISCFGAKCTEGGKIFESDSFEHTVFIKEDSPEKKPKNLVWYVAYNEDM